MARYSWLFTVVNLALLMAVITLMLLGWQPDMMTGLVMIVLMIVIIDVVLVVVLWKRRQGP